jgi:hypothetical protein
MQQLFSGVTIMLLIGCVPLQAVAAGATFLKDTAIAALTSEDLKLQSDAALSVLEDKNPRAAKEWANPQSNASGRIQSLGNFKSEDGMHCRKLQLAASARGIDSQFSFPVCKVEGGEWMIASGMKLSPAP